jgi:hypothetical protein
LPELEGLDKFKALHKTVHVTGERLNLIFFDQDAQEMGAR